MKPTKIALFIILILSGLLSLAFFFPKEGIRINDDIILHFPTIDELLEDPDTKVVDISEIVAKNQEPEDSLEMDSSRLQAVVMQDSSIVYYEPISINPEEVTRKMEFPGDKRDILYPFFKELSELKSTKKLIRILHYGDSQIEADRISSFIRRKLQGQFGGSGPGLVSAIQPYGFKSPVSIDHSEGWKRYPGFGVLDTAVKHNKYGILFSFSRFAPFLSENNEDSISKEKVSTKDLKEYNEWLQINHSPYSSQNMRKYSQCRIFYGNNKYPVNFKIFSGNKELDKKILLASSNLQVKKWNFDANPEFLRLEFNGYDSPDIYALALDGISGVAVDNIALRGSSGTVFTSSNQAMLKAIYQNLNAKLIIMQFGGNAAPSMKDDYTYYQQMFYSQLVTIKKLIPGVSIIVIGIADMSLKEKDQYVSYPNVTIIRDALKNAAFKANCAFWDTYEAMGGQNSMPSWVFADPPLAEKDFVHFNVNGSGIIAQMFYKALMFEYNDYFNKHIKKNKKTEGNVQLSSN